MPERLPVRLRPVEDADLDVLFDQQNDPGAHQMVAYIPREPDDRAAFDRHWARIRVDPAILIRTILVGDDIAGHVLSFVMDGKPQVGYWLGRSFWGRGIASQALTLFLEEQPVRPLYAHAAADNAGSIRVLEKNGFVKVGEDHDVAFARKEPIRGLVFELR